MSSNQWRAEGGELADGFGHPKSEITKIKMQQLDDCPIITLVTHAAWASFFETCFFCQH